MYLVALWRFRGCDGWSPSRGERRKYPAKNKNKNKKTGGEKKVHAEGETIRKTDCRVLHAQEPGIILDRFMYHFDFFASLVIFSPAAERFFSCFLLHGTQRAHRYITRYVRVSPDIGGACTGRRKSPRLALFSGVTSPNQKSLPE